MRIPYRGENIDILVLSRHEATDFVPTVPTIIISITSPEKELVQFAHSDRFVDILRLQFHDISQPNDEYRLMNKEDAEKVIDFAYRYEQDAQLILVHCDAGISRSAGVAAGLSWLFNNDDSHFYSRAFRPNAHCRRLVIETAIDSKEYQG